MARKEHRPSKREMKAHDALVQQAVFEGEFLALICEHPHTPDHIRGSVRFLLLAAVHQLIERIETQGVNGQLVRDVYPHAYLWEAEKMEVVFKYMLGESEKHALRVVESIQKHANNGTMPPRMFHPYTELIPLHREKLIGELKPKN